MMDHVLADAAHDEGGKGAFAAVSHNNEVYIFFVHQGGDDAAGDAGADDGGEGKALGNLFLILSMTASAFSRTEAKPFLSRLTCIKG